MDFKRGIIVSVQNYCHKATDEMASDAVSAGCCALRLDKSAELRNDLDKVPIIGLTKDKVKDRKTTPYITTTPEAIRSISKWADYVAIDMRRCNPRREELAAYCRLNKIRFVADIETYEDWHTMHGWGYSWVATTFAVFHQAPGRPDINLVRALNKAGEKRIIAEGNYQERGDVRIALEQGAYAVCIGGAITDVYKLTRKFTLVKY